jgi:hypothetical protein
VDKLGESVVVNLPTADLVGLAAKRFTEEMLSHPRTVLTVPIPVHEGNGHAEKISGPREPGSLPRYVVYGALAKQANRIKEAFEGQAEIICVDKNQAGGTATNVGADWHIVWTDFVDHKTTEAVKKRFSAERVILHKGGVAKLIEKIYQTLPAQPVNGRARIPA